LEAANLTAESAWSTFVEFAGTRLDVAADPESDRLLYQYGIYRFTGRPMFTLDFTRQFGMADNDGEDDHFVQFHANCATNRSLSWRLLASSTLGGSRTTAI
jgi:hypothetical protein